ncbi:alpha/beta fold hydrolase [Amycolatopsis sp. NPDC059235]|uniref:alpha/beta fold hydrolase n=1 Tax=Amycolatopsis sp. NPDC059235 TaxID=3346782 RepID=UPI003672426D
MTVGTVALGDGELAYEERGSGRPVVFLHAGAMTRAMWDPQFAQFAEGFRVIRYDGRGHGGSTSAESAFSHHEDTAKLLDALDVEQPVLVGCSFGSRVFADFALAYPDRVGALVLSSPGLSGMEFHDPYILGLEREMASATSREQVVECLLRSWVDGPHRSADEVDPAVREACRSMVRETIAREHSAPVTAEELRAVDQVAEIRVRTLVITGELDSSDIVRTAELLDREAPGTRWIRVPDAGHPVNLEQPEQFGDLLDEFLRG